MSKPFSLGDELYDQTDYFGRLRKFIKIIDPRNLSYSDEEIREFQKLLVSKKLAGTLVFSSAKFQNPPITKADQQTGFSMTELELWSFDYQNFLSGPRFIPKSNIIYVT